MTRILSELLGANEPFFHFGVRKLEQASGNPSSDIRLTSEVLRASKVKLTQLGLDPHDTTGPELYMALARRLEADDQRLLAALKKASASEDIMTSVAHALRTVPIPRSCFGLKATVAKRLLKKTLPKKTMKQLGYRSADSMLKREPVAALYAAAWSLESSAWRKNLVDSYKQLQAHDFEVRDITILNPTSERWQKVGQAIAVDKRHTVVGFKELGAVVLLPLPANHPRGITTATLLLALHAMNEMRAASTFLKLCQVRPDFGAVVQTIVTDEPELSAKLLDQPVPWQILQRYYARHKTNVRADMFEPVVQAEDLSWHSIERVLAYLEPNLAFWKGTQHLGLLHERKPVSMNIIDVALSFCNELPYASRIVDYFRHSLWQELLLGYLHHEQVEQTVVGHLQTQLEPVTA